MESQYKFGGEGLRRFQQEKNINITSESSRVAWTEDPTIMLDRGAGNGMSLRAFCDVNFPAFCGAKKKTRADLTPKMMDFKAHFRFKHGTQM